MRYGDESYVVDRARERGLRETLEDKMKESSASSWLVVIPKEELEGWLLSDANAINNVYGIKNFPKVPNPEAVQSPKEYLEDQVYKVGKKRYMQTRDNPKIASDIQINKVLEKCPSFAQLHDFIKDVFPKKSHL